MKRDGYCKSLWQDDIPDYSGSSFKQGEVYDVLIAGGGITGITCGLLLQKAGLRCAIAEAYNIGFGTTGGTTAHLNTFLDTPFYQISKDFGADDAVLVAKGAKEAIALIKRHVADYNIDCDLKEVRGYIFAVNEEQDKELEKVVEGSMKAGVDMKYTNDSPVGIPYTSIAVTEPQAQFHPSHYIYSLAKAFEEAGGTLVQQCRVTGVQYKQHELLEIETSAGLLQAKRVIYATHIPPGVNLLHFRCAPYRSYAMAVTVKNNEYPDAVVYDLNDPYYYYRSQQVNGRTYLIAGGEDHKTGHEENTEARFRSLEAHVRTYFDVEEVAFKWSSQYYEPTDGLPYIGRLPGGDDGVFVATGFSGNGMIYGTLSAILLTDLITKGSSEYGRLFDPNRVKPVAGFSNFVKEGADVVATLAKSVFSLGRPGETPELAPGEAKIMKVEGKELAIYKDDAHGLHIVSPTCTHIGCTIAWNNAERTWDCPCHGARYNPEGEVLTGPAQKDLGRPSK